MLFSIIILNLVTKNSMITGEKFWVADIPEDLNNEYGITGTE